MTKLEEKIAEKFLERLKDSPGITPGMIEGLQTLLSAEKKLKADDVVKVFSPPAGGDVK